MRHLRERWRRQSGQSLAVLAIAMVAIIGTMGLVVDVGNAYTVQRKVRNAVDAAALAGARELARQGLTTNAQVLAAARRYAQLNQVDPADLQVSYCDINGTALQPVTDDGFSPPESVDDVAVGGVLVEGRKTVGAYLAHVVGIHSFSASQSSMGYVVCGACSAGGDDGLFPAAISASAFTDGVPIYERSYFFWGDKTGAGNFGWLSWNDDGGHTSETTLVQNLTDLGRSGPWSVGDDIPCGPGVKNSSSVRSALNALIGHEVTVPVYSSTSGSGANLTYNISGFLHMRLVGYNFSGSDKYIQGTPIRWVQATGEAGCADMGVCIVKLRPPMTEVRSIAGVVSVWEPRLTETVRTATEHVPVDVVNVLDTSGSMADRWGGGGGEVKLVTAKRVLTIFNNYLLPDEGDMAGLVTFPRVQNGNRYSLLCGSGTYRTWYTAIVKSALTDDITGVNNVINQLSANGGTPLAGALQAARETVLPSGAPTEGRVPVLIVASDGVTNCTLDGKWTGQEGYELGGCNALAELNAVEQANLAKQAGIIIFSIAIGDDFNSDLLRAIATEDTDPSKPHFFQAVTQTDLEQIYETIANRVNNIGAECTVEEFEATGDNAVVSIFKDGSATAYAQTTTSSTGAYVFTDVDPGDYTFSVTMSRNGLTFDILTNVIGGPAAEEPITLTVGEGNATYVQDLYLRTSTPLVCQ